MLLCLRYSIPSISYLLSAFWACMHVCVHSVFPFCGRQKTCGWQKTYMSRLCCCARGGFLPFFAPAHRLRRCSSALATGVAVRVNVVRSAHARRVLPILVVLWWESQTRIIFCSLGRSQSAAASSNDFSFRDNHLSPFLTLTSAC